VEREDRRRDRRKEKERERTSRSEHEAERERERERERRPLPGDETRERQSAVGGTGIWARNACRVINAPCYARSLWI